MSRGPLSPLLFNLTIEAIALKLHQDKDIEGIQVNNIRKVLSQFADDMWIKSKYKRKSFDHILCIFEQFSRFTGLTISYNKTEILRIGSVKGSNAKFYSHLPLVWSDGPVKILGYLVYADLLQTRVENFSKLLDKIKNIIQAWQSRNLSILGKVQICNTLLMSKAIYYLQVLPPPTGFIESYRKTIMEFIWDRKPPRIKYLKLIQPVAEVGLNLLDLSAINIAFKSMWVSKFKQLNGFLKQCVAKLLSIHMTEQFHIAHYNLTVKDAQHKFRDKTKLWAETIVTWSKFNFNVPTTKQNILKQPQLKYW